FPVRGQSRWHLFSGSGAICHPTGQEKTHRPDRQILHFENADFGTQWDLKASLTDHPLMLKTLAIGDSLCKFKPLRQKNGPRAPASGTAAHLPCPLANLPRWSRSHRQALSDASWLSQPRSRKIIKTKNID